jgi:hypothetical protein
MQDAPYESSSYSCFLYVCKTNISVGILEKKYFLQSGPSVAWSMIHPSGNQPLHPLTSTLSCFMKLYIRSYIHVLNHVYFVNNFNSNTILSLCFRWKCTNYKDSSSTFRWILWSCWTQEAYPVQWNSSHPNKILWEWQGIGFIMVCSLFMQYYLH